jgi:uncharacterized protein
MINLAIIKAIRACNLRCPYCYYINKETENYGQVISDATLTSLYRHVSHYLEGKPGFGFVWHGGEPLLLGRRRFKRFLDLQAQYFSSGQVANVLQSNGTLIDHEWVDFFQNNRVAVGISLDGTEKAHNKNRPSVAGKGTYKETLEAIRLFQDRGLPVYALSVVDGHADGYETLQHFQEIGINECDFLIPMTNNALQQIGDTNDYNTYTDFTAIGSFLTNAFRRWIENPKPEIKVRLFECLIKNAFGLEGGFLNAGSVNLSGYVVVETNGDICLDTDFWQMDRYDLGKKYRLGCNVSDASFCLQNVEEDINIIVKQQGLDQLPDACQPCKVRSICRGSHPASRFGADGSFNHRSAYCEALFALSAVVLEHIVDTGFTENLYDGDLRATLSRDAVGSNNAQASNRLP